MPIISSISGLRITEDLLTADILKNYINALSQTIKNGKVAVGRDGRPSGIQIEKIVKDSLSELGVEVILLGIVPTPTVQLAVERFACDAGISITASHNPKEWNGLKFINEKGIFFDSSENKKLWSYLDTAYKLAAKPAAIIVCEDMIDYHIDKVLDSEIIKPYINTIKERKFSVAIDAVNSSGSIIVPNLLERLNCKVTPLYCENNGIFPHMPEPLPQNLLELSTFVKEHNLDIGVAVDPDADRLVLIDENGDNIGEEMTICIAIDAVLSTKQGTAVVNLSTTSVAELIAMKYDSEVLRSPVGEINVVQKMIENEAIIGGEGSGGVIFPELHYGRDALAGIVLLLKNLAQQDMLLSQLVSSYPKKIMVKTKQSFTGDFTAIEVLLKNIYKGEKINFEDGIRIDFEDCWIQIRKSNTEPIIRIIAEADTIEKSNELIKNISELVN
ncbi:MAG TPA: phosphoglucosamine mutase [Candidatus Kapabacteria bacterium]|nr:phosphoglucosamine mutase [Candidatus Kapabacteria bacterium]